MTEWVSIDSEWAYYIHPEGFQFSTAPGKAPVGSVVLEKRQETDESTEQDYLVTDYSLAEISGLRPFSGKREASKYLAKKMLDYMQNTNHFYRERTLSECSRMAMLS